MESVEEIRAQARLGELALAKERLDAMLREGISERPGDLAAARLAAELGMVKSALRELHLCKRTRPNDPEILSEFAELYADRGDLEREADVRARLFELGAETEDGGRRRLQVEELLGIKAEKESRASASPDGSEKVAPLLRATTQDLVRFLHLFSGREDVHARQWCDSKRRVGYSPVEGPLTPDLLLGHIHGSVTLGVYPIRLDGTVTFFALDLDIVRSAIEKARGNREEVKRLRRLVRTEGSRLQKEAEGLGLDLLLEDSGYKGRHLWGFLAEPLPADLVKHLVTALGSRLQPEAPELTIEVFPKQARLKEGGLGNLIKLPLGIHRRSHRRAWILGADGKPELDPWPILRKAKKSGRSEFLEVLAKLRSLPCRPKRKEKKRELTIPEPVPEPPQTAFTEANFETHPEISALLERCSVLGYLIKQGLERRRLDHDERTVIRHTMGHLPYAIPAVNYVFERCPEISSQAMLKSPLRGNPISCPKIRKRIPNLTSRLPCHCEFPTRPEHYPTPALHLDEARARGELPEKREECGGLTRSARVIEEVARTYRHLVEKKKRIEKELLHIQQSLISGIEGMPDRSLRVADGLWRLVDEEGITVLEFEKGGAGAA